MVVRAAAMGRGGNWLGDGPARSRLLIGPASIPLLVAYDTDRVSTMLAAIAARAYVEPQDAHVARSASGYAVVPSVAGVRIEVDRVSHEIQAALLDRAAPASLEFRADSVSLPAATGDEDAQRAKALAERVATQLVL